MTEYQIDGRWERRKIAAADMLHIKGLGYDGLTGYVMTEYGANSIGLGMAAQKYGSKFLSNNARPSAVIQVPGNMSPESQRTFLTQWDAMHQGIESAHRTAILTNGATINPFSINARDSQLLETREFEIREIANWLGIPPHKLSDKSRSAYNTLEQENQSYLDDSLDPSLVTWEQECRKKLLTEQEKRSGTHSVEFVRQALVRADLPARYAAYGTAIINGIMSPNEVRALENMNPREGGDEYLTPLNMSPSSQVDTVLDEEEPDDDTETEDSEDERSNRDRAKIAIAAALQVAVAHVGQFAKRAAETPKDFGRWLDTMRSLNAAHVTSVILPIASARGVNTTNLVNGILDEMHAAYDAIYSRATPEAFLPAITECVLKLETELPLRWADELTKGDSL